MIRDHGDDRGAAGVTGRSFVAGARPGELPGWWDPVGPGDEAIAGQQLGRPARGIVAVGARCRFGKPLVTVTAPLVPDRHGRLRPFPTTLWLTCPYLVEAVSRIESQGSIHRLATEVRRDQALAARLEAAHRGAARLRRLLMGTTAAPGAGGPPPSAGGLPPHALERLATSGVAGIREPVGIKCLHAHLADYLGRGDNPIGEWVTRQLAATGVDLSGSAECRCERAGCGGEGEAPPCRSRRMPVE
ncbi:MAG: DUF501 domain-containing protein [Limnochordaceae bacterium]|nr:DUF501 domain-containing protein [Limnochordaceae bacterium]